MSAITVYVQSCTQAYSRYTQPIIFPYNSTCFDHKLIIFRCTDTEVLKNKAEM